MLKRHRFDRLVNCLICWKCHGRIGPNHFKLQDRGLICGACGDKNPLANLHRFALGQLSERRLIWVPWTRSGTAAHALSADGQTPLGPWIRFATPQVFERALIYIGMTDEQLAEHREAMDRAGNGCAKVSFIPANRKNLFRIDWKKLG